MIPLEEALVLVLARVKVLDPERKPILKSMGQVLAEDVYSDYDIPPLDTSAMDGYAVRAEDTRGAAESSPKVLKVISEVAAGYITKAEVTPGMAVRIMTGAPLPEGADTVVQFEHTDEQERKKAGQALTEIGFMRQVEAGLNVRRAGEDIARGNLVLRSGITVRPQEIGVLASLGRKSISVIRRPVVAVLATGDELMQPGRPLAPGKIYNSNTYSLAAQVARYGGIPRILGIARDNIAHLEKKIDQGQGADLFLTSAGVSTGEYDVVKDVLAKKGEIGFWTVRMKPGKPLAFGVLNLGGKSVPHLGLPGNPVSSMITFEQFARPVILKMMGKKDLSKPTVTAISEDRVRNRDGRRVFARVKVAQREGKYFASVSGHQGSANLTALAYGDGLMIVPEEVDAIQPGDQVKVQMIDWSRELQA